MHVCMYFCMHTYIRTYVHECTDVCTQPLPYSLYCVCSWMFDFLGSTEVVQSPVSSEMPSPEVGPVNPPSPQGPPGVLCVTISWL